MVILTSHGCLENKSQLDEHGTELKSGKKYLKNLFVLTSIFIILNNFTLIFAKSVNKPGVRFELSSELLDDPSRNHNVSIHSSSSVSNGYRDEPYKGKGNHLSAEKETTEFALSRISFGRLQRILLTTKDHSNKEIFDSFHNQIDPHENFGPPSNSYDDLSFTNPRDVLYSIEDDQYLSDEPSKNLSQLDNFPLGNISVNSSTEGNSTLLEDDFHAIIMGIMSVVLGLLILATVIGNVFVIAAILLEKNLQNVANYLIVSLAVADLMVACLVMPLGAVYEISQGWILGPELCDMWTSSDVLCCTASILHLVAIAVDSFRQTATNLPYWAVTNVDYIHTRNGGRIITMIVIVWSVAVVVSLAPQFGWKDPEYLDRINIQQRCMISQDIGYQIFATFSTFYVPLLVILVLYWKIFQTARIRIRRRRKQRNAVLVSCSRQSPSPEKKPGKLGFLSKKRFLRMKGSESKTTSEGCLAASMVLVENQSTCSTVDAVEDEAVSRRPSNVDGEATTAFTISTNHAEASSHPSPERSSEGTTTNNGSHSHPSDLPKPSKSTIKSSSASLVTTPAPKSSHQPKKDKEKDLEAKREKKAAKTLAIITGAFVVCWLPFFIMALWMPLCDSCDINPHLASFFLWLGYFNSTLNPVIYTIFSPEFRQAFQRILCGVSNARKRGKLR